MREVSIGEGFGRVNLIGEHLDYNGGHVLPLQIKNKIICEIIKNENNNFISIDSDKYNDSLMVKKLERRNDWSDFIIGSCLFFEKRFSITVNNISISIKSSLPLGIGLSSSAAITVSTLKSLSNYFHKNMTDEELINLAFEVENDFVGVGGGVMDQFVSVLGKHNEALFLNTLNKNYELIPIFPDYEFLVIDSNTQRILSDSEFNKKKELCLTAAKKMKIQNLCTKSKINENDIKLLSVDELNVCKHVIEENLRVVEAAKYLRKNKAKEFGKLMTESHVSLSQYYGVSTDNLNKLVDLSNSFGALGSKLTGAGFGGAIVTLVKKELVEELKKYILAGYPDAKFI